MAVSAPQDQTSCRRCVVRCDAVVYLSGCVLGNCPSLYVNDRDGAPHVGCLHGVFAVEIDLHAFERLQATRPGFGALRAVRAPQPMCETDIDSAFEHRATGACLNPDFLLSGSHRRYRVDVGDVLEDDTDT